MFLDLRRPRSVLTPSQSGYCWLGLKKMQVCRDRNLGAKIWMTHRNCDIDFLKLYLLKWSAMYYILGHATKARSVLEQARQKNPKCAELWYDCVPSSSFLVWEFSSQWIGYIRLPNEATGVGKRGYSWCRWLVRLTGKNQRWKQRYCSLS